MIITSIVSLILTISMSLAGDASDALDNLNKNIENQKVLIQKQQDALNQQNAEFTKLQDTNKQLSQAIADMRDELLERPINVEAERAKFAKNLETGLTVEKLTPEQKEEYDLYDSTLKWLKKKGIKFYFFARPSFLNIKNLHEFYKVKRKEADFYTDELANKVFTCKDCREYWKHERKLVKVINTGKFYQYKDVNMPLFNVINGIRHYKEPIPQKINLHFFGLCFASGLFSCDDCTIPSQLLKLANSDKMDINVFNFGVQSSNLNDFLRIRNTNLKQGDIIIGNLADSPADVVRRLAIKNNNIPYFELSHLFDGPNNYGYCFLDYAAHPNCTANRVIAKYIYQILKPEIEKYDEKKPREYVRMDDINDLAEKAEYLKQNPDFKKYLDYLAKITKDFGIEGKVGSIVMHCNPFTLGHRYLIETAAKQVDKLVIFVVQEDAGSTYPFKDRIELVRKGVSGLSNVIVIPSSPFFASVATFPAYFVKGQKQVDEIDPSKDINIFAKYLAPTMGIKVRFVGDEPLDELTNKFNIIMGERLPEFGITLVKIPRKTTDGKDDVISASKVRKLSGEGKWDEVKKYVPETTLDYLKSLKK